VKDLELVSITLDPSYDTPVVLKEYAKQRAIDTSNYTFLTGPDAAIKSLLAQFGVLAIFHGDLPEHTLATVLIDRNGRVLYRADGSQWTPADFVERMKNG
jgi:protein SCO1/2